MSINTKVYIIKTEIINSDLKFSLIIMVDKFGVKGSDCKIWKRVMAECEMNLE